MINIYVDELPKSCKQCPYYEINSYADILGYKTNSHKCVLKGSMITGDCPLKLITDRLAEERKRVLWEIRKRAKRTQIYIKPTEKSPTGKEKCFVYEVSDDFLDQIERGE